MVNIQILLLVINDFGIPVINLYGNYLKPEMLLVLQSFISLSKVNFGVSNIASYITEKISQRSPYSRNASQKYGSREKSQGAPTF